MAEKDDVRVLGEKAYKLGFEYASRASRVGPSYPTDIMA